jgi:FkbM family methyltransferase
MFRNTVKKIWKNLMHVVSKIYFGFDIYLINRLERLPNADESYSQFKQDYYVFNNVSNGKKEGVFVDVGGNDPIKCNNTYLLEKRGWTGLAIEPQDHLRDMWSGTRTTKCLDYVIGPESKDIIFVEGKDNEHGLSGIKGYNKVSDKNKIEKTKKQKRLDEILLENNIKYVDYLSIDVEGYELNVLKSIDFSKINIKVIGLENDLGFNKIPFIGKKLGSELGNKEIRKFLKAKGYKHLARIMCDDFFIKL